MSRNVISFSLSDETLQRLQELSSREQVSRSHFLQKLLDVYSLQADSSRSPDLALLLRKYWEVKANSPLNVLVTGLGVVSRSDDKVLIGSIEKDELVENLSWSFPGGQIISLDFADQLTGLIKRRTGYEVSVNNLISARVFPDTSLENTQIITLYFDCSTKAGSRKIADRYYQELKWVDPLDVFKYFTSSTSDEITRFLTMLQKSRRQNRTSSPGRNG